MHSASYPLSSYPDRGSLRRRATAFSLALAANVLLVMALLTLRATSGGTWRGMTRAAILTAFAISMLHGLSVEWIQMYVPTRFAEWRDVWNDAAGALAGLGAAWAWGIMKGKSHDL